MANKSILEQALLQVETLEEAVKANAKGILASTMKQELNDLLKEQEDEKDPEEEENDVEGEETPEDSTEPSINDEPETEDELEPDADVETDQPDLDNMGGESDDDDVLDMTGASESEVLKVFKAMKPEDGIVVKKDGNTVQFTDDGNDYIIKLDGEEESEEFPDNLAEQEVNAETDEIVYEIELDEEDEDQPFTKTAPKTKRFETKEGVNVTKSVGDNGPFNKKAEAQVGKGVKKLQANEQAGLDHPGTALPGTKSPQTKDPGKGGSKTTQGEKFEGTPVKGTGKPIVKEPKEEDCKECGDNKVEATEAARTKWNIHGDKGGNNRAGLKSKTIFKAGSGEGKELNEEVEILRKQNGEYKKALLLFKDKLNEVATFNANLAYATRLFTEHSTTKQEKLNILKRFDTISNITESKNLYTSIKRELETSKPITETAVEKIALSPTSSSTEVLSESKAYENPQFKRMKELMSKIK